MGLFGRKKTPEEIQDEIARRAGHRKRVDDLWDDIFKRHGDLSPKNNPRFRRIRRTWNAVRGLRQRVDYSRLYSAEERLAKTRTAAQERPVKINVGNEGHPFLKILFLLFILCSLFWITFSTGELAAYSRENTRIALENLGVMPRIQEAVRAIKDFYAKPVQTLTEIGDWRNPNVQPVQEVEKKGVYIEDFAGVQSSYKEREKVEFKGEIYVKGVEETIELDIGCEMEDYDGEVKIMLLERMDEEAANRLSLRVGGGRDSVLRMFCVFPDGAKFREELEDGKSGAVRGNIDTRRVYMNLSYDFVSESSLRIYTYPELVTSDERDSLFEERGVKDELSRKGLWKGEGMIKAEQLRAAPVYIGLGVPAQPFSSGQGVDLVVRAKNDVMIWGGELKSIEGLTLRLPSQGLSINSEYCKCFSGNSLKRSMIDYVNKNEIYLGECLEGERNDFKTSCVINVEDTEEDLSFNVIRAILRGKYMIGKTNSVGIIKSSAIA